MGSPEPTVLLVEDDEGLREAYSRVLSQDYDVLPAASGADAVEYFDRAIDVALFDRRLPDTTGDELLKTLQARKVNCRTAMVTAVDPDFDIIGLGVDDYLVKPVTTREVRDAVDRLLSLDDYDETYRALSQRRVTRNVLLHEKSPRALKQSQRFARLEEEIATLEAELESIADEVDEVERELEG